METKQDMETHLIENSGLYQLLDTPKPFLAAFPYKQPKLAQTTDFPNISPRLKIPNK